MLQKVTTDRIQRFYADAESLDLKFPVSAIASATGETKGNVSKYLNKKATPSESFLTRFYQKFGKVVQQAAKSTETPQIGRITQLVKDIQYATHPSLTLEQIADKIGYSREHLNRLTTKHEDSEKAYNLLTTEFAQELKPLREKQSSDKLTTSTNKPVFDVKTNGSTSDKDTVISNLSASTKSQQETIAKLTDNLIALTTKVIEKL